jgi:hypothetical protein
VLGTAVAEQCALLISIDRDLLDIQGIQEMPLIRVADRYPAAEM